MKKFLLSCLALALCASMFATNYTSKVTITLYDGTYFPSLTIGESSDSEFANGALVNGFYAPVQNLAGAPAAIYAYLNNENYENIVLDKFVNVPMGIKTTSAASYKLFFANLQGAITIYDKVADQTIDCSSTYTFTIDDSKKNSIINDRFIINPDYVLMKGDFDAPNAGNEWIYTDDFTKNGATASLEMSLVADAWYHFQIVVNGATGANGSAFDKDNKSYEVPTTGFGTQMTLHTDAAGTYTFTWTYATNTLEIGFPTAPAPVTGYNVKLNGAGLATFSADGDDATIPDGVEAYTATYQAATQEIVLNKITATAIPAGVGVILYGTPGATVTLPYTTGAAALTADNDLYPATAWAQADKDNVFVLSGNQMFKYVGTDPVPANKAFMKLPGGANNAPARISMRFAETEETQAVENVAPEAVKAVKFVGNDGKLYIRRGEAVYTVQGQLVK